MSDLHLVLLPGLDGTGKLFKPFIELMESTDEITVVSYSTQVHKPFEALVDYVISLLPVNRPLVILGESFSGPVAIRLAARSDLNIQGLVLVATFAKYPVTPLRLASTILPLSQLFRLPVPEFVVRRYCFGEYTDERLTEILLEAIRDNSPEVLAKRAREGSAVDVTASLPDIDIPCLYISASRDRLVPKQALDVIKAGIRHTEVAEIPGPHFVLQTHPKTCSALITDFMKSIAADRNNSED